MGVVWRPEGGKTPSDFAGATSPRYRLARSGPRGQVAEGSFAANHPSGAEEDETDAGSLAAGRLRGHAPTQGLQAQTQGRGAHDRAPNGGQRLSHGRET